LVRKVFVTVKHSTLHRDVIKILLAAGFRPRVYSDQIRLTTKQDILKFCRDIGFVDGVKIGGSSDRFYKIEKNKLLRTLIESYGNPKDFIHTHFVRKE